MGVSNYAIKQSQKNIAENTCEVTFKAPDGFSFKAGQYATLTLLELANLPDHEQYHDFSIASAPEELPLFRIAFRISPSEFKQKLLDLPIGSKVQLDGPGGVFTLPDSKEQIIFIAGGIGITPFHSMINSAHTNKNITLITYNSSPVTQPYLNELSTHKDIKLINYYTKPSAEQLEPIRREQNNAIWMVAGPPGMVISIRTLLEALEVSDTMIVTEEFSGYEAHQ